MSLTKLLFLANPNADPINKPPTGPNGVINPAIAPPNPNFFTSGIAFCTSLLSNPSSCRTGFPFSSTPLAVPNIALAKELVFLLNPLAIPTPAASKGCPNNNPAANPIPPLAITSAANS